MPRVPLAPAAAGGYTISMRTWTGRAAGVAAIVIVVAACGVDQHRPYFHDDAADTPEFSATRLGDPPEEDSVAKFLNDDEREAVRRSGMTGIRVDDPKTALDAVPSEDPPKGPVGSAMDKAGKVGVSVLGVGLSLAAAAAPFLLF